MADDNFLPTLGGANDHRHRHGFSPDETGLQPDRARCAAGRRDRPVGSRVVSHRHSPQADEGTDEARGWPGHPRYTDLAWRPCRQRHAWRLVLGQLVVRAVLCRLWRLLRLGVGFPLARMRPRHGVQDPVDEQCGLPDRLLHDHAQSRHLALEPYAPSHRHDHCRARSGDQRHAAAGPAAPGTQLFWLDRCLACRGRHAAQRGRRHQQGGKDLYSRKASSPAPSSSPVSGWPSISSPLASPSGLAPGCR